MRQCYRGHSYGYYGYGNHAAGGVPRTLPPARDWLTAVTVLLHLYGNHGGLKLAGATLCSGLQYSTYHYPCHIICYIIEFLYIIVFDDGERNLISCRATEIENSMHKLVCSAKWLPRSKLFQGQPYKTCAQNLYI